jgi:hypothetical protein
MAQLQLMAAPLLNDGPLLLSIPLASQMLILPDIDPDEFKVVLPDMLSNAHTVLLLLLMEPFSIKLCVVSLLAGDNLNVLPELMVEVPEMVNAPALSNIPPLVNDAAEIL